MTPSTLEDKLCAAVDLATSSFIDRGGVGSIQMLFSLYDKRHNGDLMSKEALLEALNIGLCQYQIIDISIVSRDDVGNVFFIRPSGFIGDADYKAPPHGIEPFNVL